MRPAMVQTGLASLKFRKRGTHDMERAAREMILDCSADETGENIRLMGHYSRSVENKALVIFLHGWEGSIDSTYVKSSARLLFDHGCSVFRLNFRDHGDTHHLNEGIFLATRFDEVMEGVNQACALSNDAPIYIIGFSLGGNFALRIARSLKETDAPKISHIFAVSPVIDPWSAAPLVDENKLVQRYFKKKLIATMERNQRLYPDKHDFSRAVKCKTIMEMSEIILLKYSGYPDLESYFSAYGIKPDDLSDCPVGVSLIMSKDDPVVPANHIDSLNLSENCLDIRLNYGGHNGFFESLNGPTWYDKYMKEVIYHDIC